jgi:hypothetical protein
MAGQLTVDTLKASSGVLATQNGMTGIAKAWVQFTSSGTINGSFNVSSITVNSTGYYTVNLTTTMTNINYAAIATCSSNGSNGNIVATTFTNGATSAVVAPTTSAYAVATGVYGVGQFSTNYISTAVFGS